MNEHLYESFKARVREWDDSEHDVVVRPLKSHIRLERPIPRLVYEGVEITYKDGQTHQVSGEHYESLVRGVPQTDREADEQFMKDSDMKLIKGGVSAKYFRWSIRMSIDFSFVTVNRELLEEAERILGKEEVERYVSIRERELEELEKYYDDRDDYGPM